jgi:hypothetical protein
LIHFVETNGPDGLAAVEKRFGAAELQKHGIVGRVPIQFFARERLLVVRELIGRPAAQVVDPLARPNRFGLGATS